VNYWHEAREVAVAALRRRPHLQPAHPTLRLRAARSIPARYHRGRMFAVAATHVNSRVAWSETLQNLAGLGPVPVRDSEYVVDPAQRIGGPSEH